MPRKGPGYLDRGLRAANGGIRMKGKEKAATTNEQAWLAVGIAAAKRKRKADNRLAIAQRSTEKVDTFLDTGSDPDSATHFQPDQ